MFETRTWGGRVLGRFVFMLATIAVVGPVARALLPAPTWMVVTVVATLLVRVLAT